MNEEKRETLSFEEKEFNFNGISVRGLLPNFNFSEEYSLFVPGQGLTAESGDPIVKSLAQAGFPSFAMDLRGRGKSFRPDDFYKTGLADYAKDVSEATSGLENEAGLSRNKQVLIGFSGGGLIAAWFALEYPPEKLVLISSSLSKDLKNFRVLFDPNPDDERRRQGYVAEMDSFIEHRLPCGKDALLSSYRGRMFPEEKIGELSRFIDQESPTFVRERYQGVDIKPGQIKCPVLIVGINGDKAIPNKSSRQVADYFGADYVEGKGSHMIMFEEGWNELSKQIIDWIKREK